MPKTHYMFKKTASLGGVILSKGTKFQCEADLNACEYLSAKFEVGTDHGLIDMWTRSQSITDLILHGCVIQTTPIIGQHYLVTKTLHFTEHRIIPSNKFRMAVKIKPGYIVRYNKPDNLGFELHSVWRAEPGETEPEDNGSFALVSLNPGVTRHWVEQGLFIPFDPAHSESPPEPETCPCSQTKDVPLGPEFWIKVCISCGKEVT